MEIRANGARLQVWLEGQGPPLVLLHGGPGIADYTAPIARLLTPHFQVLRFDQRGGGASSHTPPYDLDTLLADLDALREQFGFARWRVAGHSWGADLALAYTLSYPERSQALLSLAGTGIHNDRSWKAAYEQGMAAGLEQHAQYGPVNGEAKSGYLTSWRSWIQSPELLRQLADCPVKAVFVSGEQDIRPSWPVVQLAQLMPKATWYQLPGIGHEVWQPPDHLAAVVKQFVDLEI